MQNQIPKVQAIIVTWNKKNDVLKLLSQLEDIHYPKDKLSLLVVDNNSTDGTAKAVASVYPSVSLLTHPENLGGAGGFNSGMRWAIENNPDAQYLWLLDNDIQVDPDALTALVAVMNVNPRAAICGSRIMDIDRPDDVIEAGAFIDYRSGDIRCNRPDYRSLRDATAVFKVDYVAACSLLARVSHVKKLGVWREAFFIYWDDMEWGARFNRAGYDVLASNASVVYHPSWAQRAADYSAVWRNYYRVRNSLWFFNNYCGGIERRLLLFRMIYRFMKYAAGDGIIAQNALSQGYIAAIHHFFRGVYGKKNFDPPLTDIAALAGQKKSRVLPVFVEDMASSDKVAAFIGPLTAKIDPVKLKMIVPEGALRQWKKKQDKADLIFYKRRENGRIAFCEKFRILKFLKVKGPWRVILSPICPPRMASIWGRFVAKIDWDKGTVISIERVQFKDVARIFLYTPAFLFRALFFPPEKDISPATPADGSCRIRAACGQLGAGS
jgi:GT2 family glycosyltransferase